MASFNKVLLMGNLTRDVQLKFLPSGMQVADFGVAVNRKFKTAGGEEREDILFVDVTAFGKTAEVINQYFSKGKPIFIEGRLKYDSWDDKNGGGKRSKISVVMDSFQFIGGNKPAAGGAQSGDGSEYDQRPPSRSAARPPANPQRPVASGPQGDEPFGDDGQSSFEDGDIPF